VRRTVPRRGVSLNRGIYVKTQMTQGKKKMTEKFQTAAEDSFQTGQTAKALQGYRVQSLPGGDTAADVVVNVKNNRYSMRRRIQQRP